MELIFNATKKDDWEFIKLKSALRKKKLCLQLKKILSQSSQKVTQLNTCNLFVFCNNKREITWEIKKLTNKKEGTHRETGYRIPTHTTPVKTQYINNHYVQIFICFISLFKTIFWMLSQKISLCLTTTHTFINQE